MNIVILTGNIGADVEVQTSNGTTFAHVDVASDHWVPKPDGEGFAKRTTWTRVTVFGPRAKPLGVLGKGSRVLVRGHLRKNTLETSEGQFGYSEVIADDVEFQRVKPPAGAEAEAEDAATEEASEE